MSKRRKRLERLRQNPTNVSLDDLRHVLEDYGFVYKQTVGSHYIFSYVLDGQTKLLVVPFKRPLQPIYVKRAVKLIDQMIQQKEDDGSDDE